MKTALLTVIAATTALLVILPGAAAKDKKEKKEKEHREETSDAMKHHEHGNREAATFSPGEKQIIEFHVQEHYTSRSGHRKQLPPGLAKKMARGRGLPPGWQKKVAAGETMPVEVYKAARPLPKEIVLKLPPPPPGTVVVAIEGKIARVLEKTRQILDVFELPRP